MGQGIHIGTEISDNLWSKYNELKYKREEILLKIGKI